MIAGVESGWTIGLSKNLIIPKGASSVSYTLAIDPTLYDYRLRYYLFDDNTGYIKNGYYRIGNQMTTSWEEASKVNEPDSKVDLTLMPK